MLSYQDLHALWELTQKSFFDKYIQWPCPSTASSEEDGQCNEMAGVLRRLAEGIWAEVPVSYRVSHTHKYVSGEDMQSIQWYARDESDYVFHTHTTHEKYKYSFLPSALDIRSAILDALADLRPPQHTQLILSNHGVLAYNIDPAFIDWIRDEMMSNFQAVHDEQQFSLLSTLSPARQLYLLMEVEDNQGLIDLIYDKYNRFHIQCVAPDADLELMELERITLQEFVQVVRERILESDDDGGIGGVLLSFLTA